MRILNKRITVYLLSVLVLLIALCSTTITFVRAENDKALVHDNASLLDSDEIDSLEASALSISETHNTSIYILTDSDSQGLSRKTYMENFADSEQVTNSILIFINMDPKNRGVEIQGYGEDEYRISNPRIESILDEVTPYLSDGEYYKALTTYLEEVNYYLEVEPDRQSNSADSIDPNYSDSDKYYRKEVRKKTIDDSPFSNLFVQIIISVGIGGITLAIMAYNSGGKVTVNDRTYLDSNNSRVVAHRDQYIRTTTTRVRKPKESSGGGRSGGGGGGGVSSGGRSHSGGGRSF